MATEFLKNNELALRHCLLYQFLKTKDAKNAYSNFIKAVGDDVIDFEKFEFWFDRFLEGRFYEDDNQKPIPDIKTVLQNDKKAIRACILYNFLEENQKKSEIDEKFELVPMTKNRKFGEYILRVHDSVFYSYLQFCQIFGDDVIEYQDFQYWYYRFANGEFDLEDIQMDKKTLKLEDIPIGVMEKIMEKLDYYGRCSFRRASKRLQQISNTFKFKMDELHIWITDMDISFSFQETPGMIFGPRPHISRDDFYKSFSGDNYVENAFHDMEIIFKNPKFQLKCLKIVFAHERYKVFLEAADNYFKARNTEFHVQFLKVNTRVLDSTMSILPYLKPGALQKIYLHPSFQHYISGSDLMKKMVELEQWKQAKELTFLGVFNRPYKHFLGSFTLPFEHLAHFKKFEIKMLKFTKNQLEELKNILFKSPIIECCTLNCSEEDGLNEIKAELGDPSQKDIFILPIPNSKEYFEIKFSLSSHVDDEDLFEEFYYTVDYNVIQFSRKF